ncbi:MAG: hypothetical protein R3F60_32090 [bacterium]
MPPLKAVGRPAPAARWVVGPTEARALERDAQAAALERVLAGLPGVEEARVALTASGAAIVLRAPSAAEAPAQALAAATLPPGTPIELRLQPPAPPPPPASPPLLALSGAVVTLGLLCGALLWQLRRLRGRAA